MPGLYLPPNLDYLNLKLYKFHDLLSVIHSLPTIIFNLNEILSRKPLVLTIIGHDGVSRSSILLTKDSLQTLLKVKSK